MATSEYEDIRSRLASFRRSFVAFARHLDASGIRYLSFSKVAAVEFCRHRYLLEYVLRERLAEKPAYFLKGEVFHTAAARIYRGLAAGKAPSLARLARFVDSRLEDDPPHLKNAVRLAVEMAPPDAEVLAVEEPFVLDLGAKLPPALGIVDLVLRRRGAVVVVDHKTGKAFGERDDLQLALYAEWARRRYGVSECAAAFDEYRWVNDLGRARKPAFQRTEVPAGPRVFARALGRLADADRAMREIEEEGDAPGGGECFRCPWREQCGEATAGYSWF